MTKIFLTIILLSAASLTNAQPCKVVKPGMTKEQVLQSAGQPTEMDTIGVQNEVAGNPAGIMVVWQYGDPAKDGNQRVEFTGDIVDSEVIADGKKYDALMFSFQNGEFPKSEILERIAKINREGCK